MDFFLQSFKKGSKSFRRVLEHESKTKATQNINILTRKYYQLSGIEADNIANIKQLFGTWDNKFYPKNMREFIFKFLTNCLPTKSRVSHCVDNYDRVCTFCTQKGDRPCPEESFEHLFIGCEHTSALSHRGTDRSVRAHCWLQRDACKP